MFVPTSVKSLMPWTSSTTSSVLRSTPSLLLLASRRLSSALVMMLKLWMLLTRLVSSKGIGVCGLALILHSNSWDVCFSRNKGTKVFYCTGSSAYMLDMLITPVLGSVAAYTHEMENRRSYSLCGDINQTSRFLHILDTNLFGEFHFRQCLAQSN